MSAFKPIVTDLIYEDEEYHEHTLSAVDISAHLLLTLEGDSDVVEFNDDLMQFTSFGEIIVHDATLSNDEGHQFMPNPSFSLADALTEATEGRYGDDLLSMWAGWKAEALAADVLTAKAKEVAEAEASALSSKLFISPFLKDTGGTRLLLGAILSQPGAFDALVTELSEGDYPVIQSMKALSRIAASESAQ